MVNYATATWMYMLVALSDTNETSILNFLEKSLFAVERNKCCKPLDNKRNVINVILKAT